MLNPSVQNDLVHAQLADLFDADPTPTIVLCEEHKLYYCNLAGQNLLQEKFISESQSTETDVSLFLQLSEATQKTFFAQHILPTLNIDHVLSKCSVQPLTFNMHGQSFKRFSLPFKEEDNSLLQPELEPMLFMAWHDIRNLLGITRNQIQLMQISEDGLSKDTVERLQKIDAASKTACVIAEKMTSAQTEYVPLQDCNELLNTASVMLHGVVPLEIQLKIETWPEVLPVKLAQADLNNALTNLVLNAVEACSDGGIIDVKCYEQLHPVIGRAACVEVSDNGCGIDDSMKLLVRNAFHSSKTESEQHGLGLFSVEQFVKNTGGAMDIADNSPSGARIILFLPLKT